MKRLTRLYVPAQWEAALVAVVVPCTGRRRDMAVMAAVVFAVVSAAVAAAFFFHP
ncbi:hypothetical protein J2T07_003196 [Luteibacter jiangsuensis]|uniref:Uncharacterized protein n=1 Tax=Luteibacter jiangsuensis TaxID=637577 RepID=A0ABT9T1Y6_9GAMM|nr:hypothetical protein [Luteibacter jiangsuensis]MDQ0010990.1 hypothetical protein [Luteibacter jiangsuensis]